MHICKFSVTFARKLNFCIVKKSILCALLLGAVSLAWATEPRFRATWVSSVSNIDWPQKDAVGNEDKQKADMLLMLDAFQEMHLNAIVFQVRPTADALYPSHFEPWSAWLTGTQGKAAGYDPLEFVCEEAHKRGIDVHVWINPYRVTIAGGKIEDLASTHIFRQHPEWFWKYGKQWYFEPGLDETRDWLCSVVAELVTNYDIQAIHMDDYFYPYPIKGVALPDSACFAAHPRGYTNIEDWRRHNVDLAIQDIHETIQRIKPNVEFGISPFGIWRNKQNDPRGSETNGLQNYDALYADILLWMEKGWIDYVVPQLYWEIGKKVADYAVLARWWAEHSYGCKVYIGMAPYKLGDPKGPEAWRNGNEICRQLRLNETIEGIQGECYFSAQSLLHNKAGIADSLRTTFYRTYVSAPRK